jgi:hypothetical protein
MKMSRKLFLKRLRRSSGELTGLSESRSPGGPSPPPVNKAAENGRAPFLPAEEGYGAQSDGLALTQ